MSLDKSLRSPLLSSDGASSSQVIEGSSASENSSLTWEEENASDILVPDVPQQQRRADALQLQVRREPRNPLHLWDALFSRPGYFKHQKDLLLKSDESRVLVRTLEAQIAAASGDPGRVQLERKLVTAQRHVTTPPNPLPVLVMNQDCPPRTSSLGSVFGMILRGPEPVNVGTKLGAAVNIDVADWMESRPPDADAVAVQAAAAVVLSTAGRVAHGTGYTAACSTEAVLKTALQEYVMVKSTASYSTRKVRVTSLSWAEESLARAAKHVETGAVVQSYEVAGLDSAVVADMLEVGNQASLTSVLNNAAWRRVRIGGLLLLGFSITEENLASKADDFEEFFTRLHSIVMKCTMEYDKAHRQTYDFGTTTLYRTDKGWTLVASYRKSLGPVGVDTLGIQTDTRDEAEVDGLTPLMQTGFSYVSTLWGEDKQTHVATGMEAFDAYRKATEKYTALGKEISDRNLLIAKLAGIPAIQQDIQAAAAWASVVGTPVDTSLKTQKPTQRPWTFTNEGLDVFKPLWTRSMAPGISHKGRGAKAAVWNSLDLATQMLYSKLRMVDARHQASITVYCTPDQLLSFLRPDGSPGPFHVRDLMCLHFKLGWVDRSDYQRDLEVSCELGMDDGTDLQVIRNAYIKGGRHRVEKPKSELRRFDRDPKEKAERTMVSCCRHQGPCSCAQNVWNARLYERGSTHVGPSQWDPTHRHTSIDLRGALRGCNLAAELALEATSINRNSALPVQRYRLVSLVSGSEDAQTSFLDKWTEEVPKIALSSGINSQSRSEGYGGWVRTTTCRGTTMLPSLQDLLYASGPQAEFYCTSVGEVVIAVRSMEEGMTRSQFVYCSGVRPAAEENVPRQSDVDILAENVSLGTLDPGEPGPNIPGSVFNGREYGYRSATTDNEYEVHVKYIRRKRKQVIAPPLAPRVEIAPGEMALVPGATGEQRILSDDEWVANIDRKLTTMNSEVFRMALEAPESKKWAAVYGAKGSLMRSAGYDGAGNRSIKEINAKILERIVLKFKQDARDYNRLKAVGNLNAEQKLDELQRPSLLSRLHKTYDELSSLSHQHLGVGTPLLPHAVAGSLVAPPDDDAYIGELVLSMEGTTLLLDPRSYSESVFLNGINYLKSNKVADLCLGVGDPKKIDRAHKLVLNRQFQTLVDSGPRPEVNCPRKPGHACMLTGLSSTGVATAPRQCPCNAHNCLCNRHLTARPEAPILMKREACEGERWLKDILCAKNEGQTRGRNPTVLEKCFEKHYAYFAQRWIHKFNAAKQIAIINSMMEEPIDHQKFSLFCKREVKLGSLPEKARGIQFATYKSTVEKTGAYCVAFSKAVQEVLSDANEHLGITVDFSSGKTAADLGKWMAEGRDKGFNAFVERDGKAWDSTMRKEAYYKAMVPFLSACGPLKTGVVQGLDVTSTYQWWSAGNEKYSMDATSDGTTKSGHNWTTIGNNLINAMIAISTCIHFRWRARIIVGGDDLLIAIHEDSLALVPLPANITMLDAGTDAGLRKYHVDSKGSIRYLPNVDEVVDYEKQFGIKPELDVLSGWQNASFISAYFYPLRDGGISAGQKPGRMFERLFWTIHNLEQNTLAPYKNSLIAGVLPNCVGVPLVHAFLEANRMPETYTLSDKRKQDYLGWLEYSILGSSHDRVETDLPTMTDFFCRKYDISEDDIASVESLFRSHKGESGVLKHPVLQKVVERDNADPMERQLFAWGYA